MRPAFIKTPFVYRLFSRDHLVSAMPASGKEVWLTIDDGPVPDITPAVLDILRERGVIATFFCLGANVVAHPDIFARILDEGHAVGNHTYHHFHGWKSPPGAYLEDVIRCEALFQTRLFRPPYGKFTPSQYLLLRDRYLFVLWSVLTHDYNHRVSPERCLDIAITYTTPGAIVVFHDSIKAANSLLYALPRYIDAMLERGYRFRSL